MFAMIMVHIPGLYPLRIVWIASEYILGAEAFILLAGMLSGLSGLAHIEQGHFGLAVRRNLLRAFKMYVLLVVLTGMVAVLGGLAGLAWAPPIDQIQPAVLIWQVLMIDSPHYYMTDVLLLYTILTLATPVFLWLLKRNLWWVLLAGSWGLWLGHQLAPQIFDGSMVYVEFHPSCWQIYYVHGIVLGYYLMRIRDWLNWRRISMIGSMAVVGVMLVGVLFVANLLYFVPPAIENSGDFFSKFDVRPGRLLLALITFPGAWVITTRYWQPLYRATGWLFLPLGQHALIAYIAHLPLIVVFQALVNMLPGFFGQVWVNRFFPIVPPLLAWLIIMLTSSLLTSGSTGKVSSGEVAGVRQKQT
ncbi:OpgC domain-containing protein [Oscillochloris sp. ZM17-4]|nr:OpgC domain-containing protein [Oscillochloris sp. ZM17-4]